jgi:hypothetical protein
VSECLPGYRVFSLLLKQLGVKRGRSHTCFYNHRGVFWAWSSPVVYAAIITLLRPNVTLKDATTAQCDYSAGRRLGVFYEGRVVAYAISGGSRLSLIPPPRYTSTEIALGKHQ